jgi:hypothetical protein
MSLTIKKTLHTKLGEGLVDLGHCLLAPGEVGPEPRHLPHIHSLLQQLYTDRREIMVSVANWPIFRPHNSKGAG